MHVKIGLEVHVYPGAGTKLFCPCRLSGQSWESCEICTAQPGAKPMGVSRKAVEEAVKAAISLKCRLADRITFLRKQYFYPDLPANFQRTSTPVGTAGNLLGTAIREVHLEEDAGRLDLDTGRVDFSRAGIPLIEIVTEPCIRSPKEAAGFLKSLSGLMRYAGISYPLVFKADANISLGKERVEVKNINSIRGVRTALEYESERQSGLISRGVEIKQETRHYDENRGITLPSREKEAESDYRKIADPDLPTYKISRLAVGVGKRMPEPLFDRRERYSKAFSLGPEACAAVTETPRTAWLFEYLASGLSPKAAAEWMRSDLKGELAYRGLSLESARLDEERLAEQLSLYVKGGISKLKARQLLRLLLDGQLSGTEETASEEEIREAVRVSVKTHREAVLKLGKGKQGVINFLVGEALKMLDFRAHPQEVRRAVEMEAGREH